MRARLMILVCLGLVACKAGETDTGPWPSDPVYPCIEVMPASLEFEPVEIGVDPARVEVVTVSNTCEGDLEIYDVELENPDYPFDLGAIGTVLVPASSSTDLAVTFAPAASANWSTRILIYSNDREIPTAATVDLRGVGVAPIVEVDPTSYDFGAPYIGCQLEHPFTILNTGNADLEVSDFEFATGSLDFSLDTNPATNGEPPYFVSPGLGFDVFINYQGLDEFADTAYLTIITNDPFEPELLVSATGTATLYGKQLDVFEQEMKPGVDVLFTLDRSESMDDDSALVMANLGTFINALVGLDLDYHVAIAVEDDGCVLGSDSYIDNTFSASDASSTLQTMADVDLTLGTAGDYTEAGFTLAEQALDSANIGSGGCNDGLYRESALLNLVHISDGPEDSVNDYSYYVPLFQGMKSDPTQVVMHAVAGDSPSGCATAEYGEGYYEAAAATGGSFLSICSTTWGAALAAPVSAISPVTAEDSFALTELPVPETVEVTVDGIRTTTGWAWDPALNEVVFEEDHVPAGGSTIEIEYHLQPPC